MRTDNYVLYFSLNKKSVESFYECLEKTKIDRQCSFRAIDRGLLFDSNGLIFKHVSDLLLFINAYGENHNLSHLYVIIDYPSFFYINKYGDFINFIKKTNELESFSVETASKTIRRVILQFPEVFFMFDESFTSNKCWERKQSPFFPLFLFDFNDIKDEDACVWAEYHQYNIQGNIKDNNPFDTILRGRTNLFDGSNLRYAIKKYEYGKLNVERYNFSLVQKSRAKNLAVCVEEESTQNKFNSYVLYTNGYRVLPVLSSKELKYFNQKSDIIKPSLIIRDYDLQFPDVDDMESDEDTCTFHTIDYIRGAKYYKEDHKWKVPSKNLYWDGLISKVRENLFFVSKGGGDSIHFYASADVYEKKRNRILREKKNQQTQQEPEPEPVVAPVPPVPPTPAVPETQQPSVFIDGVNRQILRGITKPVSGIYISFRQFETIKGRYDSFRIVSKSHFRKHHKCEAHNHEQEWFINTDRVNHKHGVPLDIYETVSNMLVRAWRYYNSGKYIQSAILSSEIIEVLNGFHESLTLQAYHVLAISENALAMNTIGGNEEDLAMDANFRISKIATEVERLMDREGEDRRKYKYNILNQIFSDCRVFCKEKEHFKAESRFISAMAHVNDGYTCNDIFIGITEVIKKIVLILKQFIRTFKL